MLQTCTVIPMVWSACVSQTSESEAFGARLRRAPVSVCLAFPSLPEPARTSAVLKSNVRRAVLILGGMSGRLLAEQMLSLGPAMLMASMDSSEVALANAFEPSRGSLVTFSTAFRRSADDTWYVHVRLACSGPSY